MFSLQNLIVSGRTLEEVERFHTMGVVSDQLWRRYQFLWCWSASRNHGRYGMRHDHAYERLGSARYWARIERVKGWIERIKAQAA